MEKIKLKGPLQHVLASRTQFKLCCGKRSIYKTHLSIPTTHDYPLKESFYRIGPFVEKQCYDQQKMNRLYRYTQIPLQLTETMYLLAVNGSVGHQERVSFILPGGLHKTQIHLMICPHCTHAVSFKALSNKEIGVLVITHVLLHSHLPGQSSRQRTPQL